MSSSIRPPVPDAVADAVRRQRDSYLVSDSSAAPLTGQYYDMLRATQQIRTHAPSAYTNAGIRGIRNQYGGVKSYAAAGYNYPSGQMVIGAGLAAIPYPSLETPSAARKRQMATLMGLSGIDNNKIQISSACFPRVLAPSWLGGQSKEDALKERITQIRAVFRSVWNSEPSDAEVEYYGAMQWCSGGSADTMKAVMRSIQRNGKGSTPDVANFPGGGVEFNRSFQARGSIFDLLGGIDSSGIAKWVKDTYAKSVSGGGGGGGGGGGAADTGGGSGASGSGEDEGLSQGAIFGIVGAVAVVSLVAFMAMRK
jgi:hypothetical protein